jgi:hypothetical protein
MEDIKQLQEQLKGFGFDSKKMDLLMTIAYDEFMSKFEEDLTKLELEDLESIESEMSSLTMEDLMAGGNKADELLSKVYGLQSKNIVINFVKDYLAETVEQAKVAKDFLQKANSGDNSTLASAENDPNKKAIEDAIKIVSEL